VPELSVVIPTYRRHATLRRTLARLAAQSAEVARFEVIVVDDPVEDDPQAVAAALDGTGLPVRHLHRDRRGVSAARNTGWRAAQAPVVLFLGDDILAEPELVAEHLAFHAGHPGEHAAALGHVRWADELRLTPLMVWLDQGIQSDYGRLEAGEPPSWGDFLTAQVSVKRGMLERAGGFDAERFPFLYEDTDLGLRLHRLGLELSYLPAARAEHLHPPSLPEWRVRMAETARAERRWAALHPELEPHFEPRMRAALAAPRAYGRLARALAHRVPPAFPWLGRRLHWHLDLAYRQALAPAFLAAWEDEASA
jgi:glycosyltransferase involved in cell wall biosynthesis